MFDFLKVKKVTKKVEKVQEAKDFENIPALSKYFKQETGIDFEDQAVIFKSKITSFCRTHKISSFKECLYQMGLDKNLKQELFNYLTTSESYFNREFDQIKSLVDNVLQDHGHVDILCAPAANGEEPFSIAIALLEQGVSIDKFSITGIDISLEAIKRAEEAIYNEKAIRNLPESIRNKYFHRHENLYSLNENIKRKVTFKCVNVFDESFQRLKKFDYIFSRNMLIYFDGPTRLKVQKIFKDHLKDPKKEVYYGHADLTHEHR